MNTKIIICHRKIAFGVLLYGFFTWAQASYRIVEITKEEKVDTGYAIYAGNQYLNNDGQIVGVSIKYTQNKLFNNGFRAFTWQHNRLRTLATLGTDAMGYGESVPSGLNKHGLVVGTSHYFDKNGIDQGQRAVYWDEGNIVNLGKEAEKSGFVTSTGATINASGQLAGTALLYENSQDKGTRPILWTRGKAKNLGVLALDSSGYSTNTATGMNAEGHVIGLGDTYDNDYGGFQEPHAFLWSNGTHPQELGDLGADPGGYSFSVANAINNNDQVTGGSDTYSSNGDFTGHFSVLWQNGLIQNLGTINPDPFPYNEATAINALGEVIGYDFLPNGQHAYFWSNGLMTDIGVLGIDEFGTENSFANAINNKSQVVGFSSYSENGVAKGNHAFIYQNKTLIDLNTLLPLGSGWLVENALAINDKGQVTVYGTYTHGVINYKGYALLIPE